MRTASRGKGLSSFECWKRQEIDTGPEFAPAKKSARVMRDLQAELGHEVIDSPNSIIYDETENRLHTCFLAPTSGGIR